MQSNKTEENPQLSVIKSIGEALADPDAMAIIRRGDLNMSSLRQLYGGLLILLYSNKISMSGEAVSSYELGELQLVLDKIRNILLHNVQKNDKL